MDITPQETTTQPISDDQELAKALAGVMPDAPEPVVPTPVEEPVVSTVPPLQFEETPAPTPAVSPAVTDTTSSDDTSNDSGDLDGIKKNALEELRPLIGKVDLPAEEKFDTYLMLIRSTDDKALIGPAHEAAQGIQDEKRRAEALLDIIKEIDYLSRSNQTPAQ
jgi:hypothetical protein